jgi:hypothetical protein
MSSELTTSTDGSALASSAQLRRRHHVQSPGAFAFTGDDNLARIPRVARDIQRGAGIGWQRTQPQRLGFQPRPRLLGDPAMCRAIATISSGVYDSNVKVK